MNEVRVTYPTLSRGQVIDKLKQARISLQRRLPVSKMILYGSYAQDRHTAGSDIDLIVTYRGKPRDDAYRLVMEEIRLPRLEAKVYTEEQFNTLIANSPKFGETLDREGVAIQHVQGDENIGREK